MPKLTDDQLKRLWYHYVDRCLDLGVTPTDLARRAKKSVTKRGEIPKVRREMVAWLRETVWFHDGAMRIGEGDWMIGGGKPIFYLLIAELLGFADHSAAHRAHTQWKRENLEANGGASGG